MTPSSDKVVDLLGNSLQVAAEKICIRRVADHLLVLEPVRIGMPTQVEQPQVRRSAAGNVAPRFPPAGRPSPAHDRGRRRPGP